MIIAEHLTLDRGQHRVLDDVSLTCRDGEVTALIGCNGAGKSTLLHILCGLQRADAGSVLIDQQPIMTLDARARAQVVAWLAQQHDLRAPFAVCEVIAQGTYASGLALGSAASDQRVSTSAEAAGITSLLHRRFDTLSGGEQQRVLVARCLAQAAPHLLCDEPTTHLDPAASASLLGTLRRCASSGLCVVMATHDLQAIASADRVIALADGRVIADVGAAQVNRALLNRVFSMSLAWPGVAP